MALDGRVDGADERAVVLEPRGLHRGRVLGVLRNPVDAAAVGDNGQEAQALDFRHLGVGLGPVEDRLAVSEALVVDRRHAGKRREAIFPQLAQALGFQHRGHGRGFRVAALPRDLDGIPPWADGNIDGIEGSAPNAEGERHDGAHTAAVADADGTLIDARLGVGGSPDGQPETTCDAPRAADGVQRHDHARRDRVDRAFHRDAGEAVGHEAHVDGTGRDGAAGAFEIAGGHRDFTEIAQREQREREGLVLACERFRPQLSADFARERRVVVVDITHEVAMEEDEPPRRVGRRGRERRAGRPVQDAFEVVVVMEPATGLDKREESISLRGFRRGIYDDAGDRAAPVLAFEVEIQLAVRDHDVEPLFGEVGLLILVERVVVRNVLRVPEAEIALHLVGERPRLFDGRTSFGDDGSLREILVLAPVGGRAVDVDDHAVHAVRHVDGQASGRDAEVVLVQRIGLPGVVRAPDPGVHQAVATLLRVAGFRGDGGEALHHRAGLGAEVERAEFGEDDLCRCVVALQPDGVDVERPRGRVGSVCDDEPGDGLQVEHPAGACLLTDIELFHGNGQRAGARGDDSRVVDARPIVARAGVAHLDVDLDGFIGRDEEVGFEEVVAGPVMRGVHRGVAAVDPQGAPTARGLFVHDRQGVALERIASVLEVRDHPRRRSGSLRGGTRASCARRLAGWRLRVRHPPQKTDEACEKRHSCAMLMHGCP